MGGLQTAKHYYLFIEMDLKYGDLGFLFDGERECGKSINRCFCRSIDNPRLMVYPWTMEFASLEPWESLINIYQP